jgi:hypothetical protein
MAKLIFNIDGDDISYREAINIEFVVPDDMNIYEFKIICVRMAAAMGYTDVSIKNAFGELDYKSSNDVLFEDWIGSIKGITPNLHLTGSKYYENN